MPALKPEQLQASIRSGKMASLYLFDGPESFLTERAVHQIISTLLPPEAREFNLEQLNGLNCSGGQIVSSAQSLPFLADRRVVIVRAAHELSAADGRLVAESLPNLPQSTCLVFVYDERASLREELPATASSHGITVTFWTPFKNQLPAWIMNEAKQRGRTMTPDAARELAEVCNDLQEISNELDKLILFVGKKNRIDTADLEAHGLPDEGGTFKGLEEALWNKNLTEALKQAQLLADLNMRSEAILPVFDQVFRKLLLGHYYRVKKGWGFEDICSAVGVRGLTQQGNFKKGMQAYSPSVVKEAFDKIVQADFDVKRGILPSDVAVSLLLVALLREEPRRASV